MNNSVDLKHRYYSYETRIVCFIDILGFSNLIKGTIKKGEESQDNLANLCDAINMIRSFGDMLGKKTIIEGSAITQFSDSIVISFPWSKDDPSILLFFASIKYLQIYLIKEHGVLMRGGIVVGKVIHNDQIIMGPAMIDAYVLESKCAFSPRIVIDPRVAFRYNKVFNENASSWGYGSAIHKDFDGTSYIDYFNVSEDEAFLTSDEMKDYFDVLCSMVAGNVGSSDMSIRVKYLWMRNKIKNSKLFQRPEYALIYKNRVTDKRKQL